MAVDFSRASWINPPTRYAIAADRVELTTDPHTDLWQRSYYGFRHDNAPALLQRCGAQVSMATVGQPTENPYAERVIRTIKEEEVYLADYESFADAYQRIGHFIEDVYQTKRIHSALAYLTPAEFEAAYWDAVSDTP